MRANTDQAELRGKLTRLKASIEAKAFSESDIEAAERKLDDQRTQLETLNAHFRTASYDQNLREKAQNIVSLEAQREALHAELSGLNRQSDTRAKLSVKRSDLTKADKAIEAA
jgi:DNA repair protein RAD50